MLTTYTNRIIFHQKVDAKLHHFLACFKHYLYFWPRNNIYKSKEMKRTLKVWTIITCLVMSIPASIMAQDKVEASIGADVVSKYIWRGQDLGGASIQPSVSVAYKGLSLTAWGSVGIDKDDDEEIDLTLAYESGSFSISITDYWISKADEDTPYFKYSAHSTSHVFEAQIGYDFGPLAINWYTNFAGSDGVNEEGKRSYSSYISLAAPFTLGGIEWTAEAGATPWTTDYYCEADGFSICDLSLSASKEIKITDSLSIPAFTKLIFNPTSNRTYITFSLSF